jgi:AAA domain, putative AbiEii toxin, Type IV TA system/AAA ATPase domain
MSKPLLDSLEIKGYRCFDNLKIEKLSQVNLIVGKNNVGKTALLEALWIYVNQGGNALPEILNSRNEDRLPPSFSGNPAIVSKYFFNRISADNQFSIISPSKGSLTYRNRDGKFEYGGQPSAIASKAFIRTDGLSSKDVITFWDKIELSPSEDDVVKSMKFISPDLVTVRVRNVNTGERIPYAQVENFEEPFPLKSFGDGLNRLFGLALALVNCKGGILLIDEIENGFHYSILPDVWKLIFNTAKKLNVQVFATTHSKDCLEAFAAAAHEHQGDGMFIRLQRQGEKIVAKSIDEERLALAVDYDVEVR